MYITGQHLIDRFGEDEIVQLTDKAGVGVLDETVLASAISDAQEEVDSFLAAAYTVPLVEPAPGLIVRLTCDITRYFLYDDGAGAEAEKRYERAISYLKALGKGTAVIAGLSSDTKSFGQTRVVDDRVFTMGTLSEL